MGDRGVKDTLLTFCSIPIQSMLCHVVQSTLPYNTSQHTAIQSTILPYHTIPYHAIPYQTRPDQTSVSDPGPCRHVRFRPSGDEGTRLLTAPQFAFARTVSILSAGRAAGAQARQAPECATRRNGSSLTALRGHRIVDLLQGGKVVSVVCVVCDSYGGRVVRKSLQDTCPGTPPPARRLALRDVLLGFLPGSKRTARLDSVPGEILRAKSAGAHLSRFCPAPFCRSSAAQCFDLVRLGPAASNAAHQREFFMSRDVAQAASLGGVCRQRLCFLGRGFARALQHVVPPFGGSVPPQHRRDAGIEHVPQQQGCFVAVVSLPGLREPGGAVLHRRVLHLVRRALGARTHGAGSVLAAQA